MIVGLFPPGVYDVLGKLPEDGHALAAEVALADARRGVGGAEVVLGGEELPAQVLEGARPVVYLSTAVIFDESFKGDLSSRHLYFWTIFLPNCWYQ